MELLQLRYFADAAKTENFSHTAKKNMVPQSTISQTIKKLELELGVSLFERNGNKVILNENGKLFQKGVECSLRELDDAKRALADNTDETNGNISLIIKTNRRFVTECISDFKNLYPNVNFALYHEYFGADYDKFDMWIDDKTAELKNINKELLVTENILLAVSNNHHLANRKSINLGELANERFISMPTNSSLHKTLIKICNKRGFEPLIAIQCDDPFYIRKYVAMNLGIALFPEFSWRDMFDNNVSFLRIGNEEIKRDTYVYWKASKYISNASRRFRDYLIARFTQSITDKV